jgi:hypothetical protein
LSGRGLSFSGSSLTPQGQDPLMVIHPGNDRILERIELLLADRKLLFLGRKRFSVVLQFPARHIQLRQLKRQVLIAHVQMVEEG